MDKMRRLQIHQLKSWPSYFEPMMNGLKKFDVRYNDRNYQVDDYLIFQEWDPSTEEYTGRTIQRRVTFILSGVFGIPEDTVVMSLDI